MVLTTALTINFVFTEELTKIIGAQINWLPQNFNTKKKKKKKNLRTVCEVLEIPTSLSLQRNERDRFKKK